MCGRIPSLSATVILHLAVGILGTQVLAELEATSDAVEALALLQTHAEMVLPAYTRIKHVDLVDNDFTRYSHLHSRLHKYHHEEGVCKCLAKNLSQATQNQTLLPEEALALYQMTHTTALLLEKFGITYWAGGGTLLGLLRNRGIIPHDDDVDLYITQPQAYKLSDTTLLAAFLENGLTVTLCDEGEGVQWFVRSPSLRPHLDLFALHQDIYQGLKWVHKGEKYETRKFAQDVTSTLEPWPFGDSTLMAPPRTESELYLTQVYGSTWKAEVACVESAHECTMISDAEWDMKGMALPCGPLNELVEGEIATALDSENPVTTSTALASERQVTEAPEAQKPTVWQRIHGMMMR